MAKNQPYISKQRLNELVKNIPEMDYGWSIPQDKIAIFPLDAEEKTQGGIIIPDSVQEKPKAGYIAALGPDVTLNEDGTIDRSNPFFVGQLIRYGKYAGSEMMGVDGNEYIVMRANDILDYQPKNKK